MRCGRRDGCAQGNQERLGQDAHLERRSRASALQPVGGHADECAGDERCGNIEGEAGRAGGGDASDVGLEFGGRVRVVCLVLRTTVVTVMLGLAGFLVLSVFRDPALCAAPFQHFCVLFVKPSGVDVDAVRLHLVPCSVCLRKLAVGDPLLVLRRVSLPFTVQASHVAVGLSQTISRSLCVNGLRYWILND